MCVRDSWSLVQGEFIAHLVLTFILLSQYTTVQKEDGKAENQNQHFFSRKTELCQTQLQLLKQFLLFPFLSVTVVLQRCYTVMNGKKDNSPKKDTYSKVIIIKRNANTILLAYDFMLEGSCSLHIIGVKEIWLKDHTSNHWWIFPANLMKKSPQPSLLGTCFFQMCFLSLGHYDGDNTRQIATICLL